MYEDRQLGLGRQEGVLLLLVAVERVGAYERSLDDLADEGRAFRGVEGQDDARQAEVARQTHGARREDLDVLPQVPGLEARAPVDDQGSRRATLGQIGEVLALQGLGAEAFGRTLDVRRDGGIVDLVQKILLVEDHDQQVGRILGHGRESELDVHGTSRGLGQG
jgi:hypothetical protein